jgi:hypothetical protein
VILHGTRRPIGLQMADNATVAQVANIFELTERRFNNSPLEA